MDRLAALLRRVPSLDLDDARQYLAWAACELGPDAPDDRLVEMAVRRARADGYDDPWVYPRDAEDEDGRRRDWAATVPDGGAGAASILARVGLSPSGLRRPRPAGWSARVVRIARLILAAPGSRAAAEILRRRWGRMLAGLEPASFREAARAAGVALGTAWNIEAEAKARMARLVRWAAHAPSPEQLSWLDPPADAAAATEPEAPPLLGLDSTRQDDANQLRLF
jgi:hypothetical protein